LTRCIFNLLSEKRKVYEIVKLIHLSKFFLAISSKNRHFTIYDTFQTWKWQEAKYFSMQNKI